MLPQDIETTADCLAKGRTPGVKYLPEYEQFRREWKRRKMSVVSMQRFEPLMEIPAHILHNLDDVSISKAFWISSPTAADDLMLALGHFTVMREMLRLTPQQDRAPALQAHVEQYGNPTFCRSFDLLTLSTVMQGHRLCNVNNRFDRGSERMRFCAIALLTLMCRDLQQTSGILVEVTGAMITLSAAFGVVTGGLGVCQILQKRLQRCNHVATPQWALKLLEKIDDDLLWKDTAGRPRHSKNAMHDVYDTELAEEVEVQAVENPVMEDAAIGNKGLTAMMSDDVRHSLLAIGRSVLVQARDNKTPWAAASHAGFRPFNALGYSRALEIWDRVGVTSLSQWHRATSRSVMHMFPAQGLSSKVLVDRIGELYEMAGCGSFSDFLKNWSPIPILPGIGGAPRFLSVLTRRTALLGTDLSAVRHPPQLLCQTARNLQKHVQRISKPYDMDLEISFPVCENVICCFMKCLDILNGAETHARY